MQKKLLRMTCTFSGHSIGTKSGQRAENWDILASQVTCVFLGTSPQKPGCPGKSGMIGRVGTVFRTGTGTAVFDQN